MLNYCGLEISGQRAKVGVINLIFGGGYLKRSVQFFDAGQETKKKIKLCNFLLGCRLLFFQSGLCLQPITGCWIISQFQESSGTAAFPCKRKCLCFLFFIFSSLCADLRQIMSQGGLVSTPYIYTDLQCYISIFFSTSFLIPIET